MPAPSALGRVVDPAALEVEEGARGRLRIELPAEWLDNGDDVDIEVPRRLSCARCDGGGCASCGNSGAIRLGETRIVRVPLPCGARGGVALRLHRPLGEDAGLDQLLLEIRPGTTASAGCALAVRRVRARPIGAVPWALLVAALVAAALAIAASR